MSLPQLDLVTKMFVYKCLSVAVFPLQFLSSKVFGILFSILFLRFRLLRFKKDATPQLQVREPPSSFLEADLRADSAHDSILPAEVLYMLRSVRYVLVSNLQFI